MILQQTSLNSLPSLYGEKKGYFRLHSTNILISKYLFTACTSQVSGILRQKKKGNS